jgi:PleD family two-component response regulator
MACRSGQNAYAMILEDTAEDGAVWTAERVRRNLAVSGSPCLFRAGVSSYPSHGLDAVELNERAERALSLARDWRRDRIEVADSV